MKTFLIAFAALLALAVSQTTNSGTSVNAGGVCPGCASNQDLLWIGTLNTEQIPTFSRYRDQRLQAAVNYINTDPIVANFDAMCIQELWSQDRKNFLIQGVNQKFPYSFSTPSFEQNCKFNCSSNLDNLENCFDRNCFNSLSDVFSDNGWDCLNGDGCSSTFNNLDHGCQVCVTAQDRAGLQGGVQSCRSATSNLINTAGTCVYLFGGNSDNVLLSAHPLIETNYLLFSNSPYVTATALHGKFQKGNATINLFCTHLLPANIQPANFESVNRDQVNQLIAFVNNNTQPGEFVVISGDFNNGPAIDGISGEWPNNFRLFETNGFQSTFVAYGNPPSCSYCAEGGNYLASNPTPDIDTGDKRDILIDHQFIRNGSACTAATGLFATENVVHVDSRNVPISDHYGVFSAYCLSGAAAQPSLTPTLAPTVVPSVVPTILPTFSPVVIAPSPSQQATSAAGIVTPFLAAAGVLAAIILYM